MNKILTAALEYASKGLKVFPVEGKRPVTPDGMTSATTDPTIIESWWGSNPYWGVAIRIPEWAVVVDVDGMIGYKSLETHGMVIPGTLTAISGKGKHHWFELPEGVTLSRRVNFLPMVDLLVHGYVVAPPSKHYGGGEYSWEFDETFDREKIEKAPAWIVDTIKYHNEKREALDVDTLFKGVPEGARQTRLFLYACSLKGRGKIAKIEAQRLVAEVAKISKWTGDTEAIVNRVWRTYESIPDDDKELEIRVRSLADLASANLSPTPLLVDGLLPATGYSILSSPPKKGKSLIAAELSMCLAYGLPFYGHKVKQCGVLYLDLEQEDGEAYERWCKIAKGMGVALPTNLFTHFVWPTMDEGGLEEIAKQVVDHPQIRLVVIDTLADFWPGVDKEGNIYHGEQRIVRKFTPISRDYGIGFVLVHHDRKAPNYQTLDSDMINNALGSYAIVGKAKAVWHFARKEASDEGILKYTGKSIGDGKIHLTLNREHLRWYPTPVCDQKMQETF